MGVNGRATCSIHPFSAPLGAEVVGMNLAKPVPSAAVAWLRKALLTHQVLLFRDQDITSEQQIRVARYFGPIDKAALTSPGAPPGVTVLDNPAGGKSAGAVDHWHADSMFMKKPPAAAVLRAVQIPPTGGDTLFASMHHAYRALSKPMRTMLDALTAEHALEVTFRRLEGRNYVDPSTVDLVASRAVHPVVRVHPETGRKSLYVSSAWTARIVGLPEPESEALLRFLFEHVKTPEFQCRISWQPSSVVVWDNRAVLHYGSGDYYSRRVMVRVAIAGDRPVGPRRHPRAPSTTTPPVDAAVG